MLGGQVTVPFSIFTLRCPVSLQTFFTFRVSAYISEYAEVFMPFTAGQLPEKMVVVALQLWHRKILPLAAGFDA